MRTTVRLFLLLAGPLLTTPAGAGEPVHLRCKDGARVTVEFRDESALVTIEGGQSERLDHELTGSGAAFVGPTMGYREDKGKAELSYRKGTKDVFTTCERAVTPAGAGGAKAKGPDQTARAAAAADHVPDVEHAKVYAFDSGCECTEGVCPIRRQGIVMFLDRSGQQALGNASVGDPGTCVSFHDGLMLLPARGRKPGNLVAANKQFQDAFPALELWQATPFHDGVSIVNLDRGEQQSILTVDGEVTPVPRVEGASLHLEEFREGYAKAYLQGHTVYVSRAGEVALVTPFRQNGSRLFSDGVAWILGAPEGDYPKWGAIDPSGKLIVPFMYTKEPGDFSDGLAAVSDRGNRWGFIDKTNKLVLPLKYGLVIAPFKDGTAIVAIPAGTSLRGAVIDKAGKVVKDLGQNVPSCTRRDGLCNTVVPYRLMDQKGNVFFSSQAFREVGEFSDGLEGLAWAVATIQGHRIEGFINIHGDFVVIKGQSAF